MGLGFRDQGLGFRIFGFRFCFLGSRVYGSGGMTDNQIKMKLKLVGTGLYGDYPVQRLRSIVADGENRV